MKRARPRVRLVLVAVIATGCVVYLLLNRQAARSSMARSPLSVAEKKALRASGTIPPITQQWPSRKMETATGGAESVSGSGPGVTIATQAVTVIVAAANAVASPTEKKPLQDPVAREALSLVGIDPYAEQYWLEAVNDPDLPKNERQDLIDDLNEEGLADPKHPTVDDLPLLLSRLQIIEELASWAGENLDWEESYDDLVNLVEVALGGGKPVQ